MTDSGSVSTRTLLIALGAAFGALGTFGLTRSLGSLLYETSL
jgi:hypothetical protein